MCRFFHWGEVKRAWIKVKREGKISELLIKDAGTVILLWFLGTRFTESWYWPPILSISIGVCLLFCQSVREMSKTRNKVSPNKIGEKGEIKYLLSENSGVNTFVTIAVKNGLYVIADSCNVTGITDEAYGELQITFGTPFKNSDYICKVSCEGKAWKILEKNPSFVRIKFKQEPAMFKVDVRPF